MTTKLSNLCVRAKSTAIQLIPLVMGITAFIVVVGLGILNPRNVNWLLADFDMTLEYLGWAFYRYGPWTFPIGMNPNFGLDISSSIIYSNALPIFAMVFKPFSRLLGEPFQFWGIWILLCFILQAQLAWLLTGLIIKDVYLKTLATGLILFSPPMFSQIGFHNSTVAHFPILAALYLILRPNQNKRMLWWSILLPCTLLIHPYTFAMLVALWLADLLDKLVFQRKLTFAQVVLEITCAFFATLMVAWQAGYFMNVSPGETGFGMYRMNLLAIFDPSGFDAHNWSFLYSLPWVRGNNNYEGFDYLGLGVILVLLFALPIMVRQRKWFATIFRGHIFVFCCLVCLTLFSLSNNVGIGPWTFSIPLTPKLFSIASILRASARMFWPVFYVVCLTAIYLLVRGYARRIAICILGLALAIQILDTSGAWLEIKEKINHPGALPISSMNDLFWHDAAKHYTKVVRVPVWNEQAIWEKFANYAAQNHLATNSVFMGRVDRQKIDLSNQKIEEMLSRGEFDHQTLYIVEDNYVPKFIKAMNPKTDLIARFNEINVFAPGWKTCSDCLKIGSEDQIDPLISSDRLTRLGEKIDFSRFGKYAKVYLGSGWSVPESWGVWSTGDRAYIAIPLPAQTPKKLSINAQAFINSAHPEQDVEILINGVFVKRVSLTKRLDNQIEINLPATILKSNSLKLELVFPNSTSPKKLAIGADERQLGIGLVSLSYD
jgi:hypothetical protein